jgi:3-dehydro-L-gulonate 2-dehydrogenase
MLSGGNTTREIGKLPDETSLSQVFIAVNVENYFSPEQLRLLVDETLSFNQEQNPNARYPGQGSLEQRRIHLAQGVEIPDAVWEEIKNL